MQRYASQSLLDKDLRLLKKSSNYDDLQRLIKSKDELSWGEDFNDEYEVSLSFHELNAGVDKEEL